jgi:peptidoglycan/xylan/chitin deacetylase (PgdA/CDA1 family)
MKNNIQKIIVTLVVVSLFASPLFADAQASGRRRTLREQGRVQQRARTANIFEGRETMQVAPPVNTLNAAPFVKGGVVITFDDATLSQMQYVAPILAAANQKSVLYVPTGLIGTEPYMTWDHVNQLEDAGWEIGGHTVTHVELPTLPLAQAAQEISQSFTDLVSQGLHPENFATPFGAYNPNIIAEIAKSFNSHRTFNHVDLNRWPYNKYLIFVKPTLTTTTVAEVEAWVDQAVSNDQLLVIVFHDILPNEADGDQYTWSEAKFEEFVALLSTKGIQTKNMKQVLATAPNMVQNPSFETGTIASPGQADINKDGSVDFDDFALIDNAFNNCGAPAPFTTTCQNADLNGDGKIDDADYSIIDNIFTGGTQKWTTDNRAQVTIDSGRNGSYPAPTRSVKFTGNGSTKAHLFSDKISATFGQSYGIRFYANNRLTAGELGFFIDEYDTAGNWISGKWLGQTGNNWTIDESYVYTPTSAAVAKSALQVYMTASSTGHAFIDNAEMFPS